MTYADMIRGTPDIVAYWKMGETGSGGLAQGSVTVAVPDLVDSFDRADGAIGISDSRHDWTQSGSQTSTIVSNRLECPGVGESYNFIDLGAVPRRMSASFTLNGAGGAGGVAMISGPQETLVAIVHFTCNRNSWALLVSANYGVLGGTQLAGGTYSTLATNGTTVYTASMSLDDDQATLILPDGTTQVVRDYRIAVYSGRFGTWELTRDASTSARLESVSAVSACMTTFDGIFGSGVTYGQPALITGDAATATLFHGSSATDFFYANPITTASLTTLWPGVSDEFTFEVWFKTTSAGFFRMLSMLKPDGGQYYLECNGGAMSLLTFPSVESVAGPSGWNDGVAHHLAIVRTNATNRIYLDGASSWSGVASMTDLLLGTLRISPEDGSLTFPGTLGHAAVYSRALTAAEIAAHATGDGPGALFDAVATAIATRFAAVTAPAGYTSIRVSTANPPNELPPLPCVLVVPDSGEWRNFPGKRDGTHHFRVLFYLTEAHDLDREMVGLRKWLDILAYQLRDATQLGGLVTLARITDWRIGLLDYARQTYSGIEFDVTVVTNEPWLAVA